MSANRFRVGAPTVGKVLSEMAGRGIVTTHPGRGTYTARRQRASGLGDLGWQTLALGSRCELSAEMEELLTADGDLLPLTSTYLGADLQPTGLLATAAARAARRPHGWGRAPAAGVEDLRALFAAEAGPDHRATDVVVTPGGQAALATAFRYLAVPGDPVVVESPTYPGALFAARVAGLVPVPVPTDRDGVLPDAPGDALARTGARLVYLQTRYANPTGATLSLDRREPVLAALRRAGAFLVEDDWVRDVDLDRPSPPPLAGSDPDGHVVYVRSLTKAVAPGLRVAGLAARGPVLTRLRRGYVGDGMFVATPMQHTALEVVTAPGWPRHLSRLRGALRQRRDTLIAALRECIPTCEPPPTPGGGQPRPRLLPRRTTRQPRLAQLHRRRARDPARRDERARRGDRGGDGLTPRKRFRRVSIRGVPRSTGR